MQNMTHEASHSAATNPEADPHVYAGIGINFRRAIPTDINSPYTIAGLVPTISSNEYESDVKNLVPTREQSIQDSADQYAECCTYLKEFADVHAATGHA